jgi:hypothetical protein
LGPCGKPEALHTALKHALEMSEGTKRFDESFKQHSIALSTFSYWRKRLREHVSDGAPTPVEHRQWLTMEVASRACTPSLCEVASDDRPSSVALTLRVGRVSIDVTSGFDPHLLADVLTVLEARC